MKFLPFIVIGLSTLAAVAMTVGEMDALLMAWVVFPYLFSLAIAGDRVFKGQQPGIAAVVGAVVCMLPLLAYYDAYSYEGADGQVALVYAVVPAYQIIGFALLGGIASLLLRRRRSKS